MSEPVERMRRGLLALTALGVVGTAVELATLRHWDNPTELVPWLALAGAGVATLLLALRPTRASVHLARWTGLVVAAAGVVGLVVHVTSNMDAAALDGVVGPTWGSLSVLERIWMASTGGVGPAPPLAAASIAPTGLVLALATHAHPVTADRVNAPA